MTMIERYDRAAPNWGAKLAELGYAAAYRRLFERLQLPHAKRVCDIGTGTGEFAHAFLRVNGMAADLTLVDPSASMLDTAQTALTPMTRNVGRAETTLQSLPVTTKYDTVLAAHVIEHCNDPADAVRRLHGLCNEGGRAVLVVSKPHICQWVIWLKWRHKWWPSQHIIGLCKIAGFTRVQVIPFDKGVPSRTSLAYLCHTS
ncbi:hypothetical protein ACMU_15255 [Actibacterium mucosum KCTC 23349]|uniref:Methyltransferase domain-containing protein n=1 Tax=Actibacterium mucosum KCTC 23349 TaxID=1454373 RepID=A0A037ZJU7_9RHOB|nr:methyltransferase domain-containing protein [Actibacterium mucosum]KAJ55111.1 hypothetical protein ACMU_15255 [Actibacterium mucosum KCTC 23349]